MGSSSRVHDQAYRYSFLNENVNEVEKKLILTYNVAIVERHYEYRPRRRPERNLFLDGINFEENTGIPERELARYSYSAEKDKFTSVRRKEAGRGLEVLWHRETATLIVPPPKPGPISMEDLASMTLPIVGFMRSEEPDIIVGCDRGARLYALAVHSMWCNLKAGDQKLHTLDGKLHFARLSTSLSLNTTSRALQGILRTSISEAKRLGKEINGDRLKIMFIDDWIASGATRRRILESLGEIDILSKADVLFVVLCGEGADVAGSRKSVSVSWHDSPNIIGIDYTRDGKPCPVHTRQSKEIRRVLHKATRELAGKLRQS